MDTNEYNNLLKYIDKNPELSKLIMCKTKPINFIKYNNAINFYNVDGSLNINAQYIIKHNDSIMGLITIIDINTQNKKHNQNHYQNDNDIQKNQQEFGHKKRIKP